MNVVLVTKRERKLDEAIPNNLYVIENTGLDGIIIWQDEQNCGGQENAGQHASEEMKSRGGLWMLTNHLSI